MKFLISLYLFNWLYEIPKCNNISLCNSTNAVIKEQLYNLLKYVCTKR